ncbi:MAG: pseudouridine synthase, partial [Rikenellaceae bacterium]
GNGGGERREFGGEKKPFKKSYGDRPSYGGNGGGERREFGGDNKKPFNKSYGDRPSRDGFRPRSKNKNNDQQQPSYPKYDPNRQVGEMRLNRFLAQSGVSSRREADEFIKAGVVTVNGVVVTELGTKVMPTDEVKFNDSRVQGEKRVYLVLNKPKGYVTSLDDPHADKTVMDLVNNACSERIYPVGRLDKNSVGILLFTNDGDLTKQLTHPSHRKKKIYQVSLDKPLTRADMDSIAEGITLEDGDIYADEISYVADTKDEVGIEIHSGRNRIVRRIFEHLGYSVQKLDRVYFAGLTKKNLKRGQWRFLTPEEVERLKSGRYE